MNQILIALIIVSCIVIITSAIIYEQAVIKTNKDVQVLTRLDKIIEWLFVVLVGLVVLLVLNKGIT